MSRLLIAGLSLLLSGCFITPGKFSSELVVGEQDAFSFTYEGEIFFLGLAQITEMSAAAGFEPQPCLVEGTGEERRCTANEIEGQRATWEAEAAERAQQAKQMSAMIGGLDPNDPEARAKLVERLRRQKGWSRVVDKGQGVFDVSYRLDGTLTHDFMFPVIEGVPTTNPFVQVLLREGETIRVNAPGFAAVNEGNPMSAMFGGFGALGNLGAFSEEGATGAASPPTYPEMEGTFTIRLARGLSIRANNTDEGPQAVEDGQVLIWDITASTRAAPTALIAR